MCIIVRIKCIFHFFYQRNYCEYHDSPTRNVKESEKTLDLPFCLDLFWPETRPPSRFCGYLPSGFCVILLTIQQTNGHGSEQNLLDGCNKSIFESEYLIRNDRIDTCDLTVGFKLPQRS